MVDEPRTYGWRSWRDPLREKPIADNQPVMLFSYLETAADAWHMLARPEGLVLCKLPSWHLRALG